MFFFMPIKLLQGPLMTNVSTFLDTDNCVIKLFRSIWGSCNIIDQLSIQLNSTQPSLENDFNPQKCYCLFISVWYHLLVSFFTDVFNTCARMHRGDITDLITITYWCLFSPMGLTLVQGWTEVTYYCRDKWWR